MSKSGRFAVLSVALALSFALVDPASAQTTNGLVAYYSMTGNAHDDSSHGNDGNLSASGATLTSDRLGQANSAYQFDAASGGNILVHGSDSLDVGAADGLTIAAWLNPATVLTHRPIVEWGEWPSGPAGAHFWLGCCWDNGTWAVKEGALIANIVDTNGNWHLFSTPCNQSISVLSANSWQHVALTYDKTTGMGSIYLNGNVVATEQLGAFTPRTSPSYSLHVGARPAEGLYYSGTMDELRIYGRALSGTEVSWLSGVVCR